MKNNQGTSRSGFDIKFAVRGCLGVISEWLVGREWIFPMRCITLRPTGTAVIRRNIRKGKYNAGKVMQQLLTKIRKDEAGKLNFHKVLQLCLKHATSSVRVSHMMLLKKQSVCVCRYIFMSGVFAQSFFRSDTPFIPLSRSVLGRAAPNWGPPAMVADAMLSGKSQFRSDASGSRAIA